jgi:hypothetical protein
LEQSATGHREEKRLRERVRRDGDYNFNKFKDSKKGWTSLFIFVLGRGKDSSIFRSLGECR